MALRAALQRLGGACDPGARARESTYLVRKETPMTPGTRQVGKALDGATDPKRKDNKKKGRKAVRAAVRAQDRKA